ncbi:hypothetical protein MMC13_008500 [Lambiella insularis]|nr:hypothetical protein [Lambiella insularis]
MLRVTDISARVEDETPWHIQLVSKPQPEDAGAENGRGAEGEQYQIGLAARAIKEIRAVMDAARALEEKQIKEKRAIEDAEFEEHERALAVEEKVTLDVLSSGVLDWPLMKEALREWHTLPFLANRHSLPHNRQIRQPAKPFRCSFCDLVFETTVSRDTHENTGDRPYMCVLCNDTFSRSDILKRHFQKCSVRRGNPEGVSHLSHPHAHRQKQPATSKTTSDPAQESQNGAHGSYTGGTGSNSTPVTNAYSEASSVPYTQAPVNGLHRANSDDVYQTESSTANGGWFSKQNQVLYQSAPVSPEHFNMDLSSEGHSKSSSASGKSSMTAHHAGDADWNSPFYPVAGDSYMNPMFPTSLATSYDTVSAQSEVKKEIDHQDGTMNGLYIGSTSFGADGTLGPTPWNSDMLQDDPLQTKADRLVDFCFPGGMQEPLRDPNDQAHLRMCLTPDNLRHFLELFTNFQGHFHFIHMPTFNFLEAFDGLILAIACIGAVYSDRITQAALHPFLTTISYAVHKPLASHLIIRLECVVGLLNCMIGIA